MSFDYGAEATSTVSSFKNPTVGSRSARLSGLVHIGSYRDQFKGEFKSPCNYVIAIFELKGKNDMLDDETPMVTSKAIALREGDLSFVTKFRKALDPENKLKGFDDFIGLPCTVTLEGSDEKNDKGEPKYVNFKSVSAIAEEFAEMVKPLVNTIGHVRYSDITKEALMALTSFQIADYVIGDGSNPKSGLNLSYKGSKAEQIINEIRVDNPEFGRKKSKKGDDKKGGSASASQPSEPMERKDQQFDENEEF